jgi:excisionase family DNA binding protein
MNNFKPFTNENVLELRDTLKNIERLLLQKSNSTPKIEEGFLTVKETAEFLKLSVPTIYGLIHKGEIPVMKRSKRCYFSKSELIEYIKKGKKKHPEDFIEQTDNFIKEKLQKKMLKKMEGKHGKA